MARWKLLTRRLSAAAILLCVASGCSSAPGGKSDVPASAPAASGRQTYELKGTIVAVDKPGKKVTVSHEDIPGFMTAMTMAYPVKDDQVLESLSPGERITANVVAEGEQYWLEKIAAAPPAK
jgi:protein SCO1